MTTEERLDYAEDLARQINIQSSTLPKGDLVRGTDPNEFKKLYAVFCRSRNLVDLKKLIDKLIQSQFCRTKKTQFYYQHIRNVFEQNQVYQMEVEDAIVVLGWIGRFLKKN